VKMKKKLLLSTLSEDDAIEIEFISNPATSDDVVFSINARSLMRVWVLITSSPLFSSTLVDLCEDRNGSYAITRHGIQSIILYHIIFQR